MAERHEVEFAGEGRVPISAWFYLPSDRDGLLPAITMANGFGMTRWHGLVPFAEAFADAGFAVLVHDHRNFGHSGGDEPDDIDPWRQIADWRYAISFLENCDDIDPDRIGLWGTSYAGGHAMVLGATDRRLRAVVAQVPMVNGHDQGLRRIPPEIEEALEARFADDDRRRLLDEEPLRQAIVSGDPHVIAAYRSREAVAFYNQHLPDGVWSNKITLRSVRAARMYEPGVWAGRISPTPLLMVVALQDRMSLTGLALEAYERALEPKGLVTLRGGHFCPFAEEFPKACGAALNWFQKHLTPLG